MKWIGKHPVFSDLLIGGVLLTPPDNQYSYELTLPNDDGASGQVLSTDGNGVLSWVANGVAVPNALTAGTGVDYASGTTWDGSAANTINLDLTEVIATDGANRVLVSDGDGTLTATDMTYSSDQLLLGTTTSGGPLPLIQLSNNNTGPDGPRISFIKLDNGADDDELGEVKFQGDDAGGGALTYASFNAYIADATDTEEAGRIEFKVAEFDGTLTTGLTIDGDSNVDGRIDVIIAATTSSLTTIAGELNVSGTTIRKSISNSAVDGEDLNIRGGNSGAGTDLDAGDLILHAGLGTGSGTAGSIQFKPGTNGTSGTSTHGGFIHSIMSSTTSANTFKIHQPGSFNVDYAEFKVETNGATTLTTVDAAGVAANLDFVIDGQFSVASTGIDISGAGVISNAEWQGTDVGIAYGGTGQSTAQAAIDALTAVSGASTGEVLVKDGSGNATWAAQTDTTYSAGDGLDLSGTTFSTDLKSNGGLVIESTELAVDLGASSITGTLAVGDGGTGLSSVPIDNILTGNGTGALTAESDLTFGSGVLNVKSSTSYCPHVIFENNVADNKPPKLTFKKDKGAAGADNDYAGEIIFVTDNSVEQQTDMGLIRSKMLTALDTDESAELEIKIATSNGTISQLRNLITGDGHATNNTVNVNLAYGATSTTTIAGTLIMGSTAAMTNTGLLSVGNQSNITGVGTITSGEWRGTDIGDNYVAEDLTIVAGSINNTPIGASTANTIRGTTIDATTDFTVGSTIITDDQIQFTPSAGDTATITAATNGALNITTHDSSGSKAANIIITANGTAEVVGTTITLDSGGDIELEVAATTNYVDTDGIYRGGNVGPISDTFIPVLPVDFISSDSYRNMGSIGLGGQFMAPSSDRQIYYAQKIIPKGYTASACIVNGVDADGDARFVCYVGDISGTTPLALHTATSVNSTATFGSNIVGDGEKYCTIAFDPGDTTDTIYGAKITIAKT